MLSASRVSAASLHEATVPKWGKQPKKQGANLSQIDVRRMSFTFKVSNAIAEMASETDTLLACMQAPPDRNLVGLAIDERPAALGARRLV